MRPGHNISVMAQTKLPTDSTDQSPHAAHDVLWSWFTSTLSWRSRESHLRVRSTNNTLLMATRMVMLMLMFVIRYSLFVASVARGEIRSRIRRIPNFALKKERKISLESGPFKGYCSSQTLFIGNNLRPRSWACNGPSAGIALSPAACAPCTSRSAAGRAGRRWSARIGRRSSPASGSWDPLQTEAHGENIR